MCDEHPQTSIAPHRGFNSKARDVLIGDNHIHRIGMTNRSASEFDLRRKVVGLRHSQSSVSSSPKAPDSATSMQEPPVFDSIGEQPVVKRHKKLQQIGKMKSCCELKHVEKRLIKTYEEENIIKMPSIDSELSQLDLNTERFPVDMNGLSKARTYGLWKDEKK